MPFAYYDNLNTRDRAVYRQSDGLGDIVLPDVDDLRAAVGELEGALQAEQQKAVQAAAVAIASRLVRSLGAPRVKIKVLARRPSSASEELHGLYSFEEGETAEIRVWMRTAAKKKVVRFRTFLRTLLHELCHHLDFAHFGLRDSFHTEGFFRRESSLMRQLAPPPADTDEPPPPEGGAESATARRKPKKSRAKMKAKAGPKTAQLELPMMSPKPTPAGQ